ncbi:glycosyltransferase family 4 protein [Jannaschia sp. CCS1]|uniref:glycosyltransferase family 4 protein n=1 Tax=Jannaschia sp. (strain CCS1) TaxID=290400 RepID=UPI00140F5DC3|nr:glycosyltransferase [Jannaschia sp. CCS1]
MTPKGVGDAWVGNELRVMQKAEIPFVLHALNHPDQTYFSSDDIATLESATNYIYPLRQWVALWAILMAPFRFGRRFFSSLANALVGPSESFRNRAVGLWHFALACHWAAGLRASPPVHIHSQWIHSAGTVAMYGAWLLDRPFSFTGHAADLFRNRQALDTKIARAEFIICISEFHRQFYLENGADPAQLHIAYCGIDTSHFTPRRRPRDRTRPYHILSSGRLVEKKGFADLIRTCVILRDRGLDYRCTIAGSGPDEGVLRAQIAQSGLEDLVTLTGEALKQEDIPDFMATGDVYTLPCIWASDNDVDGLPQMLMEAMACGLPAISTRLVGIPDLIHDGETGLLVDPNDPEALADALMRLESDTVFADDLSQAGYRHLVDTFDLDRCLEPLLEKFRASLEAAK